jgi:hypothetical protein
MSTLMSRNATLLRKALPETLPLFIASRASSSQKREAGESALFSPAEACGGAAIASAKKHAAVLKNIFKIPSVLKTIFLFRSG